MKRLDRRTHTILDSPELLVLAQDGAVWRHLQHLASQMLGLPRHLGIHNGGMILQGAPLWTRLPVEPATMEGRTVVQWDKEQLEDASIIKLDILGLRMLSVIAEATTHTQWTVDSGQWSVNGNGSERHALRMNHNVAAETVSHNQG